MKTTHALWVALLLVTPLCALGDASKNLLDQFAPTPEELERWEEDATKLIAFGETPQFFSHTLTGADEAVRVDLEKACQLKTFLECRDYIRSNRQKILRAMPDNPVYWERFWSVMNLPNIVYLQPDTSKVVEGTNQVIQASYYWFYRSLAARGRLDFAEAATLFKGARNWRIGHQTLIARMIGIAINGIANDMTG